MNVSRRQKAVVTGYTLQLVDVAVDRIDILNHILHGSQGEAFVFIERTKGAMIPGAVSRDSQTETIGFAGGADGTLFQAVVG
jgi:hypothetical protein